MSENPYGDDYHCDGGYDDEEEECEYDHQCDYILDGYATTCCLCGEYEIQQRCADQLGDMIDRAVDEYKDRMLMESFK